MGRVIILLAIIAAAAFAVGIKTVPDAPPVLLDVADMVASGRVPLKSPPERHGRLYWSTAASKHFSYLEVASFAPRGRPEIITGEFTHPIEGRMRAMRALGADRTYRITDETPETVVYTGGPFVQFTLYRTWPYVEEYTGFFAATRVGLANLE
jgi:hypothetical protein